MTDTKRCVFCKKGLAIGLCLMSTLTAVGYTPDSIRHVTTEVHQIPRYFGDFPFTRVANDPIMADTVVQSDSVQHHRNKALQYQQQVLSRNAFVNTFSDALQMDLPVGIASRNQDPGYAIIISAIRTTPHAAYIDAYVMLQLPTSGEKIAFRGTNIEFSNDGGFTGAGRLQLVGDYFIRVNPQTLAWLIGKGNTFVDFDCNGFRGMSIEAEVQLSRDLIVPEDQHGNIRPGNERVKARFVTYAQSWGDILIGVKLPPFQFADLPGFGFEVSEAFLDWSDRANPPAMVFPPGYTTPFVAGATTAGASPQNPVNLWQGFFLRRLAVRLPRSFKSGSDSTRRVAVGAEGMLLDERGLSGILFAENVIDRGTMSGWHYTLDRLAVEVVTNAVSGFQLKGTLSVPLLKTKDGNATRFGYIAQRGADGSYQFATRVDNELRLPLLLANLTVHPGSTVTVVERNDRFFPTALLNGHLGIKGTQRGPRPELLGIRFEGLRLSTEAPQFNIQSISFGRDGQQQTVSNFPVVINRIAVRREPNRLGIGFDLTINISGNPQEDGFGGTAGLVVWGKHEVNDRKNAEGVAEGQDTSRWKFDTVELSTIRIRATKPGVFSIDGIVRFFDQDPTYGDGFSGDITGTIGPTGSQDTTQTRAATQTKAKGIGFRLFALFGRTPAFRYWYADAMVELRPGLPIIPGVLDASGFGGGYYHRMRQSVEPIASGIGRAPSGITYVPDENTRGVRAMLTIATPKPAVFNGLVTLEIPLNRHGGINSITLAGNAQFLNFEQIAQSKLKELANDAAAGRVGGKLAAMLGGQVYASFVMHFDNVNDVFHGSMETFINVAGGVMRGVGPGNRSGWAVIHFEKNYWQVLIGTPDQPIGIEVARLFRSRSYLMAGHDIPGSPPPPQGVGDLLGGRDLDYMRELNAIQSGVGLAFGLHFAVNTGDINFLIFFGRFNAGVGADLMLKDYGTGYRCAGSSEPFGINGWYANGQAYAFLDARIGIRVNLRFYQGEHEILSLRVATIMQTKAPNPFWMRGVVSGDYRILGGLVKGHCRFEVTIGEECRPVGEQELLANTTMIAGITPAKHTKEVDVFTTPQVAFNIPVGQVFEVRDIEKRTHAFRAALKEFTVTNGTQTIPGALTWNSTNDVVVFEPRDLLPGQTTLTATARLVFEQRMNGVWRTATFQDKTVEEVVSTTFETSQAPDFIPPNNVLASYPLPGMSHFYPREHGAGFIQLGRGQAYLFEPGPEWIQKVRMTAGNRYIETDLTYRTTEMRVEFSIPSGFENGRDYKFEILNIPRANRLLDANVQRVETELVAASAGAATLTTKAVEGTVEKLETKAIYSSNFRTSRFNTFTEKMKAIQLPPTSFRLNIDGYVNVFRLVSRMSGTELFDPFETPRHNAHRNGLVDLEAVLNDNDWFTRRVQPLVYEGYPLMGSLFITHRDLSVLGLPPARDLFFSVGGAQARPEHIVYNVNLSVHRDFNDLLRRAADFVVDNPGVNSSRLGRLLLSPTPRLRQGTYQVRISYFIPGQTRPSSSFIWTLTNPIPD
jgi:hypothetical protein